VGSWSSVGGHVLGGGMGILVVWAMSYCGFIFHDTKSQKQKQQQRRQQIAYTYTFWARTFYLIWWFH